MNRNIEVINNNLLAVRFSYLPQIPDLKYSGDTHDVDVKLASFTEDGKIILNKQHELYPTLKAMFQRIMVNTDQELEEKINAMRNKTTDQYEKVYTFILDAEKERRSIFKQCKDKSKKCNRLRKFFKFI